MDKAQIDLYCTNGNSPPVLPHKSAVVSRAQKGTASNPEADRSTLLDVREAAEQLNVSESWVRRHAAQLHAIRLGRLIRFDPSLLRSHFSEKMLDGKSLEPERQKQMLSRYQRGSVYVKGKKLQTWYGMFREDVVTPQGIKRRLRNVRLGTKAELPTKNLAREKLAEILGSPAPAVAAMEFWEVAERWKAAEGPAMKSTTLDHYSNALRAYVLPVFGRCRISSITRENIQTFLAEKARSHGRNTLRSMKVVISLVLGWATDCSWLEKNPCSHIKLPLKTGGRQVTRTILAPEQIAALAARLEEPYATLVLFLGATGLRIGEAIAVRSSDFDGNVLTVSRRIYGGVVDTVKSRRSVRALPIDPQLAERMRVLGAGHEWVFTSRTRTPINPGNALKRYIRPASRSLGFEIGGWHDFRHSLATKLRRDGVHPKVVSDILGHSKVNLAMDVYDRTDVGDFEQPLSRIARELLPSVTQSAPAA